MFLKKFGLYAGILINSCYSLARQCINIDDTVAIVIGLISIVMMTGGILYNGWCLSKGINPFAR